MEVEYQTGKRATLKIFHDGEEREKMDLQGIETEAEMIQMMIDKGFRMKPEEEVARIRQAGGEAQKREAEERNERMEEQRRRMESLMQNKARGGDGAATDSGDVKDGKLNEEAIRDLQMQQWKRAKERYAREQAAKDQAKVDGGEL